MFRNKYHKLKYGTDLDQGAITPPNFDKDSKGWDILVFYNIYFIAQLGETFIYINFFI